MSNVKAYNALWNLLKAGLDEAKRERRLSAVAARMGVEPSTVSRWANHDQPQPPDIAFKNALDLAFALEIPMEKLAEALLPEDFESATLLFRRDRETMKDLALIILESEEGWQVIRNQIRFVAAQIKKSKA